MPVPTLISDLDTTAASNSPPGAESVGNNVDNYVRAHAAFIAQVYAGETGISDGIVKATSGTMAPAVAGTDYASPATAQIYTQKQTFQNTIKAQQALEKVTITAGAPEATQNFDWLTQAIQYFTSDGANNWTLNVRGDGSTTLNSLMEVGESATLVVKATMGATPYYASAMTIDGNAVTPKWIGGTAPSSGDASCINIYTYTITKTADATFVVEASKARTS